MGTTGVLVAPTEVLPLTQKDDTVDSETVVGFRGIIRFLKGLMRCVLLKILKSQGSQRVLKIRIRMAFKIGIRIARDQNQDNLPRNPTSECGRFPPIPSEGARHGPAANVLVLVLSDTGGKAGAIMVLAADVKGIARGQRPLCFHFKDYICKFGDGCVSVSMFAQPGVCLRPMQAPSMMVL